ncbi:MAG: UDP-glucose/GDP-mannose dehydrogenase family protein [Candidatus Komeilibacteria bacterium]|nr:UDP-glucose/GDP-mannose dehydrogenase family protein [Candidatus Komeilibacteria bacterium]
MKVTIIGLGYVGLVTAVGLSELGHQVFGCDTDPQKIASLKKGQVPFYEPGLDKLLKKNFKSGRLVFTANLAEIINQAPIIFICVGTPAAKSGQADLSYVESALKTIAQTAKTGKIIVIKSTVPVGTSEKFEKLLNPHGQKFPFISCSEFLREGLGVNDFFQPDRIIVGATRRALALKVLNLFAKIKTIKFITNRETAELIKYTANSFLAMKISFINEIANLCEKVGADVMDVAWGIGLDKRINPLWLKAGIGYGGSCFPKDVWALRRIAENAGYDFKILKSVIEVNQRQSELFIKKIQGHFGQLNGLTIGVLGLAFKNDTDDIRDSVALRAIEQLVSLGVKVKAYDPLAMPNAKKFFAPKITLCHSAGEVFKNSRAVVIATEWPQFKNLPWQKFGRSLKERVIFDGKNLLDPATMEKLKFKYYSIGR